MNVKKKNKNRGFTLVELIVSIAILGIIIISASTFLVTGTRTYSSLNYSVRLQYEAQLAMAQLQEYTIDCTSGMAWDDTKDALYIANGGTVHIFDYDGTTQTISYGTGTAAENLSFTADSICAEHVTNMDVKLLNAGKQVEITLTMMRGKKTYTATQVIALRNQPVHAENWADLWNKIK